MAKTKKKKPKKTLLEQVNAVVNKERLKAGLEPLPKQLPKAFLDDTN